MTYDEVKGFLHKKIIVTDIDGNHITGIFTNTVSEYDTLSGKEEIEVTVTAKKGKFKVAVRKCAAVTEPERKIREKKKLEE